MANILKMHEQNTIQQLAAGGWGVRRIAREMRIDRKTVRRYLKAASKSPTISTPGSLAPTEQNPPISTPGELIGPELVIQALHSSAGRPALCEKHRALIEAKLDLGLTAQRIYQNLVIEVSFAGSYQSVRRFVRKCCERQPKRIWQVEVQPGEEVQIDFGAGAPILDCQGH